MKIAERLQTVTRVFLDTAPVIYYVEANPRYHPIVEVIFDRLDYGALTAVTSPVTLAECLVFPHRLGLSQTAQDFCGFNRQWQQHGVCLDRTRNRETSCRFASTL